MATLRSLAFGFNPDQARDPFGKWLKVGAEVAHAPEGSAPLRPRIGTVKAVHRHASGRVEATVEWRPRNGRPALRSKVGAHDLVPKSEVDKPL